MIYSKSKKKILVYGNFYQGNLAHELVERLNEFKNYNLMGFDRLSHLEPYNNRLIKLIFRYLLIPFSRSILNINLILKIHLFKPDIFIAIKGLDIYPISLKFFPKTIKKINWNLDDFENTKNSNNNLIKSIKQYDLIISPKKELFENYKNIGAKKLLFIENYYISSYHKDLKLKQLYNISFVGSWSKKREKFIQSVSEIYKVHVFGNSWSKVKCNKNLVCNENVEQHQYVEIVNQSKISLNFFTDENNDTSNLRLFEVPACKGLILSEFSNRASEILTPNKDAFFFKNENELIEKISFILNMKEIELNKIRINGFKKIKSFDLNYRIEEVLNVII